MQSHHGGTVTDALVQSSGKMVLIAKLLPKLKASGHKVCEERGRGVREMCFVEVDSGWIRELVRG